MRIPIGAIVVVLLCSANVMSLEQPSGAFDTITPSRPIRDGETIISSGGTFELGFFSPGDPSMKYVGIWFKRVTILTAAWVANRLTPVIDGKGVLRVTEQGKLILENGTGGVIWSSSSLAATYNPVAQLLDSGNLVVRNGIDGEVLWQSFDYPTDTALAGMKIGINRTSGFNRHLTSWRGVDDPSPGNFTYGVDLSGFPQMLLRQGSDIKYRAGPWNGVRWSGSTSLSLNKYYTFELVFTDEEAYFHYQLRNPSFITRLCVSSTGILQRFTWIDDLKRWQLYLKAPVDICDTYGLCGPHSICTVMESQMCACLKGFIPKVPQEWDATDWSQGCIRRTALGCGSDIFIKYEEVKLPDTHYSWFNRTMNMKDCHDSCKKNCSCMAYSNIDIRDGGSGCLQWHGNLVDIRTIPQKEQELYVRMSAAESGLLSSSHKKRMLAIELLTGLAAIVLMITMFLYFLKKMIGKRAGRNAATAQRFRLEQSIDGEEDLELPLFDTSTVSAATGNFSLDNKLGEGGFGPVYKGVLNDGQEVAVKKLSSSSKQGLDELKNEVTYIAKLQHRNLVKLVGCCIQEDYLLIYEFMPNGSLDSLLFDPTRRNLLHWKKRFDIITGIARGLTYLHHDSRLRIIHRDLKASNILLDKDMNPKISDFGLARGFMGNETAANTNRVVGTYGYMSPEYTIDGAFSIKSDVFSYGVLILEIVSGQRNRGFSHPNHQHNLLGHAWNLLEQDRNPLELLDQSIEDSYEAQEVIRCIHVGLLCVQQCPEDRPSMSKVVMMLESEMQLPSPKEPGFFNERKPGQSNSNTSSGQQPSNRITTTVIFPR